MVVTLCTSQLFFNGSADLFTEFSFGHYTITVPFSIKFLHRYKYNYNLDGQYYQNNEYTSTETSKIGQLFQQHQEGKRRKTNYTDVITLKGIIN